ncbi:MAG: DUF1631 family protein, partial [Halioglobus sp.]|nr:DUF1631 family protein [Halioglobus sp.]
MMSNVSVHHGKLSATLVLDNAVELAGHLSPQMDGSLRLEQVQRLDEQGAISNVTRELGSFATLSLSSTDGSARQRLGDARVKISRWHKNSLTLEFSPPDSEIAKRYREAISAVTMPARFKEAGKRTIDPTLKTSSDQKDTLQPWRSTPTPRGPLTTASSARNARLLERVREKSLEDLANALRPFLGDLNRYLRDLAAESRESKQAENPHFQAAVTLHGQEPAIARHILQQITDFFAYLTPEASDDHLWQYAIGSTEDLHLIELEEYEDFLAIERTVAVGEERHSIALEALTVRLAALVNADPNLVRLPIGVRQLCRAFQSALRHYPLPHLVLPDIFDYFGRLFAAQLQGFYDPLNAMLVEQGIRPTVENEIETKGSLLERNRRSPERDIQSRQDRRKPTAHPGGVNAGVSALPPPAGSQGLIPSSAAAGSSSRTVKELEDELNRILGGPSPARLYRSVIDALNFKREADGLADGETVASGVDMSGTWDGATVASTDLDQSKVADAGAIAQALTALQRSAEIREQVQETESLRTYLANNLSKIGGLKDSAGLTTDSLNQLDMVDNLFGTIKSQLDVSSELKPALGNLQIPLAKLALLDQKFFVDREHTARAVIDKLSGLATSGNFPNRALEDRINDIVDSIVRDYEHDETIFDAVLSKIDVLVAQQELAKERNKDRVIRAQEGQQRLNDARKAVGNLIRSRIKPPNAPRVLQELIESGWKDLLVLTHVREGEESVAWEEQVKAFDQLCLWLDERRDHEGGEDLSIQRSLEAEPFLDLVKQQISAALPTNIAHEEVLEEIREILAGNLLVEVVPVQLDQQGPEKKPEELRARIEELPRLRRWIKRVEELENDKWLTYKDQTGQKKRMQLAWISPKKDRYIFVNERGQKVAELSAIRLARLLSRGAQPPKPTDQLSVVDQSMYETLEHVQKSLSFSRNHDSLTRMINRETYNNQMTRALRHSQLKHSHHAALYLNIDQFTLVNTVYDHVTGDQVLLEFAKLLAQLHGKKASSARLSGDEFSVLLLDRTQKQAVETAEAIRTAIEKSSIDIDGENVSFTVSIGVAAIQEHSSSVDQILEDARSAMLHAKQGGRNQVVIYEEEQSRIIDYKRERFRTKKNLENAIAAEHFVLRAQPIMQTQVSDRTNSSVHYELLLGLLDKDGSITSPREFIQSAERYGFMTLVDRWVIKEAFTWISHLMDQQKVVPHLAINLSGNSVTDNSFMEYLLEQISEFGVGTSRLCFEITEAGTISNLVKAADFVQAFRNIGCKFSIDDFGTGLA